MTDLRLGNDSIDGLNLGSEEVTKLYLGDTLVWPRGGSFSPADLSPAFWFDADDSETIIQNAGISVWVNKGTVALNATQINTASRPNLAAGGLNGRNIINCAASPNTYLEIAEAAGLNMSAIFDASGSTVFILKRFISGVVEFKIEQYPGNRLGFEGGNRLDMPNDTTSKIVDDQTTGSWICMLGRRESQQVSLYYNGLSKSVQSNTDAFNAANASLGIGAAAGGFFSSTVDIAEILVYPRALSISEINQILAYFDAKWGITQLAL